MRRMHDLLSLCCLCPSAMRKRETKMHQQNEATTPTNQPTQQHSEVHQKSLRGKQKHHKPKWVVVLPHDHVFGLFSHKYHSLRTQLKLKLKQHLFKHLRRLHKTYYIAENGLSLAPYNGTLDFSLSSIYATPKSMSHMKTLLYTCFACCCSCFIFNRHTG